MSLLKPARTLLFLIAACLLTVPAGAQERVLKVSNWAEYVAEDTVSNFEKEFDIKVIYDTYDSVEAIDSKLLAGNSGYDVVIHASSQIARLIPAGVVLPIDKSKLPNLKHVMPQIGVQLASKWDPNNRHIVPFMWGTHGITYNEKLVKETHPGAPIGSLDLIFDPEHMKKLSKCGVAFMDSPTDIIPMALAYLGLSPDSTLKADYDKVAVLLKRIRPYIKTFDNYAYQRMPQKEFCICVTWGPDGLFAMSGAAEANTGVELDFFLPPETGTAQLWVDGWVIPKDAENIADAHLFMNYMLRPQVAANDSNYSWYATANKDAIAMVDPAVTGSIASYPPEKSMAQMYTLQPLTPKMERVRTRVWTKFKSGN